MDFLEGIIYMLWRGIAIGVIISAPMGPVGILCVQRTLEKGRNVGFFTGVGAAISDLFYCLLTGFGLSFIEDFLKANQNIIQLIGSIVLIIFGVYLFRSNPARTLKKPEAREPSKGKNVLSGFLFTFSNPLIIFLIIGLFARFNFLLPEISAAHYVVGFISIFLGALLWWWIVAFFIDKVRNHFNLRSMWLINKITGGIIMVFGAVGVITAISGMASAKVCDTVYYNSERGFGPWSDGTLHQRLRIEAAGPDTATKFLNIGRAQEFTFSLRCANLHNRSGKSYPFATSDGKKNKISNCTWGISLKGVDGERRISFKTVDNRHDELMPLSVRVTSEVGDSMEMKNDITDGVDFFTGTNSLRLISDGSQVIVSFGNRRYYPVLNLPASGAVDSVGIWVAPGGLIEIDDIALSVRDSSAPEDNPFSHFADPDVRKSYFMRSDDRIEGIWEMFDRSLEETKLRPGGNYRIALVRNADGYEIIYLDGAVKLPSRWLPGMSKGCLRNTSFQDVYDAEWIDPSGRKLPGEIKCQYSSPGLMTLMFTEHDGSTLRLRKIHDIYEK